MNRFYVKRSPCKNIISLVYLPSNEAILVLTESQIKEVYEQLGEYIKSLPTPHPHAELMKQYAEDAAARRDPWVLWEYDNQEEGWNALNTHPTWNLNYKYRRKEIK